MSAEKEDRMSAEKEGRMSAEKEQSGASDRVRPTVHLSIDVPNLADGLRFYERVFGFVEKARPFPTMAVLDGNNVTVCMHEKKADTPSSTASDDRRRYDRHWTPVHMDLHVVDFDGVLAQVRAEGGRIEQEFRGDYPKPAAFCSDPFGNGFCVIGEK